MATTGPPAIPGAGWDDFNNPVGGGIGRRFEHPISNHLEDMIRPWNVEKNPTGAVLMGILARATYLPGHTFIVGAANTGANSVAAAARAVYWSRPTPAAAGAAAGGGTTIWSSLATGTIPEDMDGMWFRDVATAFRLAPQWMIDLIGCHQVRALTANNISGYFQAQNRSNVDGRTIEPILDPMMNVFPKMVETDAWRARLSNNTWIGYHTAFSSTGNLCSRMLDGLGAVGNTMFSPGTITAIRASNADPWNATLNQAIPQVAIGAAHAFHKVYKTLPDKWYQGDRAKDALPPVRYSAMFNIFEKLKGFAESTGPTTVGGATDEAQLVARIPTDLRAL